MKNDQKQFLIKKEKLRISKEQINECIKKHHDESLKKHSNVNKTLQFLRQHCSFLRIRQHFETYLSKCFDCQQNKHATHAKYDEI